MRTIRRKTNDETFGQDLSDISVVAFQNHQHCDVTITCSDGSIFRTHQVVLSKSPTLKAALGQEEVRCQPEATLIFPQFARKSIAMLLQFLYTGEVDLVSASQLLVEFQELCRILKLNPQVKKTKFVEGMKLSYSNFNCTFCETGFDKHSKLIFHNHHCGKKAKNQTNGSEIFAKTSHQSTSNAAAPSDAIKLQRQQSLTLQDDFVKDNDYNKDVPAKKVPGSGDDEKCISGGGVGFRMPDNFDLPDEIIQEQIPAARSTSTPIRYSVASSKKNEKFVDKGSPRDVCRKQEKKEDKVVSEVKRRVEHKREPLKPKGFSMAEDLAEKKKRLMLKLRGDEHQRDDERTRKLEKKGLKRPLKDNNPASSSSKKMKEAKKNKRKHFESSSDDEASETTHNSTTEDDESEKEVKVKTSSRALNQPGKKLSVKVDLNGNERILELHQYRSKLQRQAKSEEDDDDDSSGGKPSFSRKPLKLEKVGKRIKRIISEDSSEDSSSTEPFYKKESRVIKAPAPPMIEEKNPPKKTSEAAAASTSSPQIGGFFASDISKLPRIPKLPRDPNASTSSGMAAEVPKKSGSEEKSGQRNYTFSSQGQKKPNSSDMSATKSDTSYFPY